MTQPSNRAMTVIAHVLDRSCTWEHRRALTQLIERLPSDRFRQHLVTIDPADPPEHTMGNHPIALCPARADWPALAAPALRRHFERHRIDLIHAWGSRAAAAARATALDVPLVVEWFDPLEAARAVRLMRTLSRPQGFAAACGSGIVRRRLVEGGLSPDQAVLIRPAVDFGLINRAPRARLRTSLGIGEDTLAVLSPAPLAPDDGTEQVLLAMSMLQVLGQDVCLMIPGATRWHDRLERLDRALPDRPRLILPADRCTTEELVIAADALVIVPAGDIATTIVAWAMAAGTPVIGSATYAVAELIAHGVNGLLFKRNAGRSVTGPVTRLLRDRGTQQRVRETARGQAYEVFGLRRCIEQHERLYANLLSGEAPGRGLTDSALAG